MVNRTTLSQHTLRALAVASGCDPRTVQRYVRREAIRGLPADRIAAALTAHPELATAVDRARGTPPAETSRERAA